jgi:hypothetical protein
VASENRVDWERRSLTAEPRSAYLLSGPVRNEWEQPKLFGTYYPLYSWLGTVTQPDNINYPSAVKSKRPGAGGGRGVILLRRFRLLVWSPQIFVRLRPGGAARLQALGHHRSGMPPPSRWPPR